MHTPLFENLFLYCALFFRIQNKSQKTQTQYTHKYTKDTGRGGWVGGVRVYKPGVIQSCFESKEKNMLMTVDVFPEVTVLIVKFQGLNED